MGDDLVSDSNVHHHFVYKVLITSDQGVAVFVLEAHTVTVVKTIKVLYGSNDGVGAIVGVYVDSHGQTSPLSGYLCEEVFEYDLFRGKVCGRGGLCRWGVGNCLLNGSEFDD
jgi:hypothetical protein